MNLGRALTSSTARVPRTGYDAWVKDAYSFTSEGLERLALAGLSPQVVWSALRSQRRLIRHLTPTSAAVFAVAEGGEYMVVAVVESTDQDNDWDIVGARAMDPDEVVAFNKHTGRLP